jgi:hypothetical protein
MLLTLLTVVLRDFAKGEALGKNRIWGRFIPKHSLKNNGNLVVNK